MLYGFCHIIVDMLDLQIDLNCKTDEFESEKYELQARLLNLENDYYKDLKGVTMMPPEKTCGSKCWC